MYLNFIFTCCYIHIQSAALAFKNRFSFVNVSVYVCQVVYICVSANARMHFFQMELSAANELSFSFSANHISLASRGTVTPITFCGGVRGQIQDGVRRQFCGIKCE